MNDRTALLRAMILAPFDKLPRRVYRDWLLDGFREDDVDAATIEFVGASCDRDFEKAMNRFGGAMPREAYRWLIEKNGVYVDITKGNWQRLVPSLILFIEQRGLPGNGGLQVLSCRVHRTGRQINFRIAWDHRPGANLRGYGLISLEFWYGFVRRVEFYGLPADFPVMELICRDQPLAVRIPPIPEVVEQMSFGRNGMGNFYRSAVRFSDDAWHRGELLFTLHMRDDYAHPPNRDYVPAGQNPFLPHAVYERTEHQVAPVTLAALDHMQALQRVTAAAGADWKYDPLALPIDLHADERAAQLPKLAPIVYASHFDHRRSVRLDGGHRPVSN